VTASRFRAQVTIEGLAVTEEFFKEMGNRAFATEVLMEEMAERLEIAARSRLQGSPWKPLASDTVARKSAQGEDTGIMRDEWRPIGGTPTRRGDALWTALDGGAGSYKHATRTTATYGVNTKGEFFYARFVQNVKGTKRKLLAIPADHAVGMVDTIVMYILGVHTVVGGYNPSSSYISRRL
jgi:hypothetical protein